MQADIIYSNHDTHVYVIVRFGICLFVKGNVLTKIERKSVPEVIQNDNNSLHELVWRQFDLMTIQIYSGGII